MQTVKQSGPQDPAPSPSAPPRRSLDLVRRSLPFLAPYKARLLGITGVAVFLASLGAVEPLVMKRLFDVLGAGQGLRPVLLAGLGLLAIEVGRALVSGWLSVITWDVRLQVEYRVREQVVERLNTLPISYHQRGTVGGTMNRVNQSIAGFLTAFGDVAFTLVPTLAYLGLAVVAMLRLEWRLAALVLLFTPLPALIGAWAAGEQTHRERRLMERWTSIYSRFNEVLSGIVTVKSFAMEDAEKRRFLAGVREGYELVRRGVRTDTATGTLRGLAVTLARLAALMAGGVLVVRGEVTVGTLVAFLGYIGGLFGPVQGLTNTYQTLRRGTVALEVIFEILDAEDVVADPPDAREAAPLGGEVEFRDVSFAYQPGRPVLRNINLAVRPGEMVALVGPSGCGKSTLLALLQRHHPLDGGSIRLDGVDIRTITKRSLRSQIGIVLQDVHLFNDTVRANLAYGRPEATDGELEAAARAANAHDFIMALPQGYDTIVGERGGLLSGGQRQRVAIARALLRNPPILILDEATSALDAISEALIQEALRGLVRGRTTFVVAHRLSTVVEADRIVVMQEGEVVAVGTHDELMRASEYYASLVRRQSHGFLAQAA